MKIAASMCLILAVGLNLPAQEDEAKPKPDARLDFLKKLAGTWVVTGEEAGRMKGNINTWIQSTPRDTQGRAALLRDVLHSRRMGTGRKTGQHVPGIVHAPGLTRLVKARN